ncbi:hypothetical protein S140_181 [Shewanella sp. phage 1/40]|uniref:hypothetical protein n=1 Tax=Shewanella phage 1/4 TaxID=1458859 RepID=UPI0004F8B5E1|nr:hypothetical protein S14_177 [Shewanella sp. phage 1/4]YP_009104179.1 hypothetical protein S140_181 [Shewanella sp. phage 1/40]AHK11286.1 hypothetical protein S14_177 [Shewanella sp. phage 1/4]AHK11588.1 hypothetical protein S140_181 [Shewanella sp. phage 1/40]
MMFSNNFIKVEAYLSDSVVTWNITNVYGVIPYTALVYLGDIMAETCHQIYLELDGEDWYNDEVFFSFDANYYINEQGDKDFRINNKYFHAMM